MTPRDPDRRRSSEPVPEEVVRLVLNDVELGSWTASPHGLDDLGAGHAMALGYVRGPGDILGVDVTRDALGHRMDVRVPDARLAPGIEERDHRRWHGCGLRFLLDCRPDLRPDRDGCAPLPGLDAFPDLFRQLFQGAPDRTTTGGHHTTALTDGSRLTHLHEVIGRHNGVDKSIGGALLAGDDLTALGLVTTARISGEIAEKAVRARLAFVASRSVPTTLAVEIATAAGLPLVARAAGKEARVF